MSEQHNLRRMIASLLVLSLLLPTGSIPTGFVLGTAAAATTSTSQVYTLTFQGYDYNNKGEVSVLVNNQVVATLPPSYTRQNAKVFISVTLDISRYVLSGANTVTFRQNLYSSGVQNVQVTGPTGVLLSDSAYHELWTGGTRSVSYSFSVSQATTTSTTTTTTSTTITTTTTITSTPPPGSSTYTLSFQGYDFDNQREVTVLVNNQVVAALPAADSSQNNNAFASFSIDISKYVIQGANTITFKQNLYSSAVQNVQVTRPSGAVLLSDSTNRGLWTGGTATAIYSFNVLAAATTTTSSSSTTTTTILPIPVSTTTTQTTTSTSTTTATSTTTTISQSGGPITYAVDIVNGQLVDASGKKFTMVGLNYGDIPENFVSGSYATDAQNMKNAGFNTVKLVKEWGSLENSANPSVFTYDNTAIQNMMAQISALTQNGINVVVKIHADSAISSDAQHLHNFLGSQYCAPSNSYDSGFSTSFYTTSYLADSTTGHAHLTNLLLKISQLTRDNSRVIGFDVMNEPNYCSYTSSSVSSSIRTGWHQRIVETAQALRNNGDNRIIFAEEAPFFEYYSNFVSFNDPRIVSSIHWYRAEYKTSSSSGTWAACWADMPTLQGYWGNTGRSGSSCSSVPIQVAQAQQKYPNQLFEVGEFGNIYRNTAGDLSDQWIKNSIALFQAQNIVGMFYWSSEETGTWVKDLGSIAAAPTTTTTTTTTATSTQTASQSITLAFQGYDYDNNGEVSILVNNQVVATLPTVDSSQNNNLYSSFTLDISRYLVSGVNTVTFKQNIYSSGVRNVQITGSGGVIYSNATSYTLSDTGVNSVTYNFNI